MKPRSIEYDQWMRFRKSIDPPVDDDEAFDRFVEGQLIVIHVDQDGNEICRAGHWIGADSVNAFDDLCEEIMGDIVNDYGDKYDYSDPDDADDEDKPEIIYTGGGIYCGLIRLDDGWFYGELNGWGGIWETREQAIECIPKEEEGLVRIVENLNEQIGIWVQFYDELEEGRSCDLAEDYLSELVTTLVSDLKSY